MATKLVIFDMDGLMFDTEAVSFRLWSETITKMGFEPCVQLFTKSMGGHVPDVELHYEKFFGRKFTRDEIDAIFHDNHDKFVETLDKEGIGVKTGLLELLDFLEEIGMKKAIGSASSQATIKKYLARTNISPERFDFIMSGDMAKNLKPDPEIFLTACEKVGVAPADAIVLEDSRNGLYAANAAGIPCVFVPDMLPLDEDITSRAFKIVGDLNEVIEIVKEMI